MDTENNNLNNTKDEAYSPEITASSLNEATKSSFTKEQMNFLKSAKDSAVLEKMASYNEGGAMQNPYPSPFLTLSDTQIPKTTSELLQWCKYFYTFDPLINGAVTALANFPITEVYFEDRENKKDKSGDESGTLKTYKRVFHEAINITKFLVEIGIDYYLYGNCFIFGEMWINPSTQKEEWKSMVRLDPSKIIIDYNPVTREKNFKWNVPARVSDIIKKKQPKKEYDKIPDIIKQAVAKRGAILLNPNNVYHFSRPTDSMGDNNVWGTPIVANVMKLLMYRNVLRQAQEAIAREHIVPMRVYYLQRTNDYNPSANWNEVAADFASELMRSVRDPNHKVVSPVPVSMLNVGGEGRALLLTPEIEQVQNEILAGMGVPREFIFGGVSYSGTSLSLKILENNFITYRLLIKDFLENFCIKKMAIARGEWASEADDEKLISVKLNDLKMQDDVQQKQLMIELNTRGKVSDTYMWKMLGLDPDRMRDQLEDEAASKLKQDFKIQVMQEMQRFILSKIQMKNQIELQQYQQALAKQYGIVLPTPTNGSEGSGEVPPQLSESDQNQPQIQNQDAPAPVAGPDDEIAEKIQNTAAQIQKLPPEQREMFIRKFPPEIGNKLRMLLADANGKTADMRPMPEQLPPRRKSLEGAG